MAQLDLPNDIVTFDAQRTFIPLGKRELIFNPTHQLNESVAFRVRGLQSGPTNGFWGTLGRSDDQPMKWEGTLYCSEKGNDRSHGDVSDIIDAIRAAQPDESEFQDIPILEKYIAFDDVEFSEADAGDRNLRLTIMLNPGEGAVAFYHYGKPGDESEDGKGEVEYILPEEGNDRTDRAIKKTFHFEVPEVSDAHNDIDEENAELASRFVVKVLVFNYPHHYGDIIEKHGRYAFLKYDHTTESGFDVIDPVDIDFTKRTLLLLHGTFATTEHSFRGLHHNEEYGSSLLQKLLNENLYEQIIGFDHKTLFDGTTENVTEFKARLDAAHPGWSFTQPIDIIATSRGGLVAKTLAGDESLNSEDGKMRIEKIILASCPNGAALLDPRGKKAMRAILSGLAAFSGPLRPLLIPVLQLSAIAIFNCRGLKVQTHDAQELNTILAYMPKYARTRYYPICGNWTPHKFRKKILDFVIDQILVDRNDWVNYTDRMHFMPVGKLAYQRPPEYFLAQERLANAIHTNYFVTEGELKPHQYVESFLRDRTGEWVGAEG
jgi:hypothetical protein